MKKLLSFLAAGALALGLIGCSGDLHDTVDPSTIPLSIALQSAPRLSAGGVPGAMNDWDNTTTWTTTDDSTCTYVYEFKATAETIEWKAITTAGNWNSGAWGGGDNEALSVPLDTKTALIYDGATGGKKNCSTTGLKEGKMYSITLNYESGVYNATVTALDKEAPVPFYIDGYAISGSMNNWAYDVKTVLSEEKRTVNEQNGYVTYKYDFEADSTSVQFGIRSATDDWATKYVGADFVYGTDKDYVETTKNGNANNKVTGLTAGGKYRLYIQTTPAGEVSYKVVILKTANLSIKAINLPVSLEGTDMYLRGELNSWKIGDSYKATVTNNSLKVNFSYDYEEEKLSYKFEGKFSIGENATGDHSKGDGWGIQLSGEKGANLTFEFNDNAKDLIYNYDGSSTGITDIDCTYYQIDWVPDCTKVVMIVPDDIAALSKVTIDSNISWGGTVAGKWSADTKTWSNASLEVKPNATEKTITFYVTKDYDVTGNWVEEQAASGTNFKFQFSKDAAGEKLDNYDNNGGWFNLDVSNDSLNLNYSDKEE